MAAAQVPGDGCFPANSRNRVSINEVVDRQIKRRSQRFMVEAGGLSCLRLHLPELASEIRGCIGQAAVGTAACDA